MRKLVFCLSPVASVLVFCTTACSAPLRELELAKNAEVVAVAFSHDGKRIAISAMTSLPGGYIDPFIELRELDSTNGLTLKQRPWNDDTERNTGMYRIRAIEFSPDGKWLVGSDSHGYFLWEVASGAEKQRWTSGITESLSPGWSPDSKLLALPSMEQEKFGFTNGVALIEIASNARLAFFPVEIGYARTARFSPDGKLFATAGHDCTVRVFDVQRRTNIFNDHLQGTMFAVNFSPDGKSLLAGSSSAGVLVRYEVAQGNGGPLVRKIGVTQETREEIHRLDFSPNGAMAFTTSHAGLRFWTPSDWTGKPSIRGAFGRLSPNGALVAVVREQAPWKIELWKPDDLRAAGQ